MAQNLKIKEFPDLSNKLTAPSKKSLFEKQKAEAEAKRLREEEETAAVYQDFVKSFDDDDGHRSSVSNSAGRGGGGFGFPGSGGGPSKRHFSSAVAAAPPGGPAGRGGLGRGSSGPGSLGPSLPPLSRKRALDGSHLQNRDVKHGMFAFNEPGPIDTVAAFQASDDEDEKAARSKGYDREAPKPTVHLSSLPPGTSPAVIKSILPPAMKVDNIRIIPPSGPASTDRRSLAALVTLAKDVPAVEIDTAVSALQNRYLGWGFYLSISRHLSSASVGLAMPTTTSSAQPFGAKPIFYGAGPRGAPPSHRGGFAPPASYGSSASRYGREAPLLQVNVVPPSDLKQLKLIHKTLENLLVHGPEFEALLMSRPDVQRDEKWAWLWDPRSEGGIWYRWRLWDILTSAQSRIKAGRTRNSNLSQHIFDGGAAWQTPADRPLLFEYTTSLDSIVSDSDYNSSEDEDSGDEGRRRLQHLQGNSAPLDSNADSGAPSYLNPLQKAKLVHLLARLPSTTARLRRGDVARVTAFAIQHAGEGADEVVDLITTNVHRPFALANLTPERKAVEEARLENDDPVDRDKDKDDPSSLKLIALYLISDILSTSSTSGVRHAWRYRQLFETALRAKTTFEHLGRLERSMGWGRLRAEKWKRSVMGVLSLWEGWCVFPATAQEKFVRSFQEPPLSKTETAAAAAAAVAKEELETDRSKDKGKWKTVDEKVVDGKKQPRDEVLDDAQGEATSDEDIDGVPMVYDDEDDDDDDDGFLDGEPMDEEAGDGSEEKETPEDTLISGTAQRDGDESPNVSGSEARPHIAQGSSRDTSGLPGRRRRPRAEDMFADSDGE